MKDDRLLPENTNSANILTEELNRDFERFIGVVWILSVVYYLVLGIVSHGDIKNLSLYFVNLLATTAYFFIIYLSAEREDF